MSDKEQLFNSLQDATGEGVALHRMLEADLAAAKNALAALTSKRPDGKLYYNNQDSSGALLVNPAGAGDCIGGVLAITTSGGPATRTAVGATFALTPGKALSNLEWSVGCTRQARYEIVIEHDGGEVPVHHIVVGEGSMQNSGQISCLDFLSTTGLVNPKLKVFATNKSVASDFSGLVSVKQEP